MTTQNIKSATRVLSDFLDDQAKDEDLDAASVSIIASLRTEGKLTKTNLLRRIEEARKAEPKGDAAEGG
ncbi:MAG: hypothetical protein OXL96_11795 [Candidatus Poribacteria bacterium]|nr:hypothetical protein [Candidatus Poribacteria bacterium]